MRAAVANDCAFHLLPVIVLAVDILKTTFTQTDKVAPTLKLPLNA